MRAQILRGLSREKRRSSRKLPEVEAGVDI